jgi:ubiquinone/menaquinone biosynthesis C-methylase UbiE
VFTTVALFCSSLLLHAQQVAERSAAPQSRIEQGGEAQRESWQRVPDVLTALGAVPGAVIADIGAGEGFFTTRIARAVGPAGKVFAVDISQGALFRLDGRLKSEQITNVEIIQSAPDDPKLPEGALDAALIVNAYHEMKEHQAMLEAIRRALKPGGRLVILESVTEDQRALPRTAQESRHQLAPHYLQRDVLDAGFYITRFEEVFTRRGNNHPEFLIVVAPVPGAIVESRDRAALAPGRGGDVRLPGQRVR